MVRRNLLEMIRQSSILFIPLLFAVPIFSSCGQTASAPDNSTVALVSNDSVVTQVEAALLESVHATTISAPANWRMEYRIVRLAAEGSLVQPGDTLVVFDKSQARSKLQEAEAKLALQSAKLEETRQKNRLELAEKENNRQQLQIQADLNRSRLENARFESHAARRQLDLELQKTELQLKRAGKEIEAQQMLNANSENLILLAMSQARVEIARARQMLSEMVLTAPKGGMVIYDKGGWRRGGEKVKVGDTVYPQSNILSIPDLNSMKAVIALNEVDRPAIRTGLGAEIQVEAYPDTVFTGTVQFVSRIVDEAGPDEGIKSYHVDVHIHSMENYRLKPGLSARVRIFNDTLHAAFSVPSWCLAKQNNSYFVQPIGAARIPVRLARLNDGRAFVYGNLQAGWPLRSVSRLEN